MSIDRRTFLQYVGFGAAAGTLAPWRAVQARAAEQPSLWLNAGAPDWIAPLYPLPLPGDGGSAATDAARLAHYTVRDELVLPEGYRFDVVAVWGDVFERADGSAITFGYNCDFTCLIPMPERTDEYWLIVNHEYQSARPWYDAMREDETMASVPSLTVGAGDGLLVGGIELPSRATLPSEMSDDALRAVRDVSAAALETLGVSILHVRRERDGMIRVVPRSDHHRRVSGASSVGFDEAAPLFTGPAVALLGDGASIPPRTFANCSGGVTPWGTMLTCEENVQDQVTEPVDRQGRVVHPERTFGGPTPGGSAPDDEPFEFIGIGAAIPEIDPRSFGWVAEIDPAAGTMRKHTALGRFRHENVALRAVSGRRLAAYMGDDRRGGHVWKFISDGAITDPADRRTGALLESGTLHAARLDPDHRGRWIPLLPSTPLARPDAAAFTMLSLPDPETGIPVRVTREAFAAWVDAIERVTERAFDDLTLGDLVDGATDDERLSVILLSAHAMANAAGATPSARPEDIEVHPLDASVYIAFTDTAESGGGCPDRRIFTEEDRRTSRSYGALFRLAEDGDDPAATTFTWGRFVASGELADGGGGFACADNLAFDPAGNLWMVTDITTTRHNAAVDRARSEAGTSSFRGVFGNNAMFCIPTSGAGAGVPTLFALGPTECELTGPTILPDGDGLLLAVQHPGELYGRRGQRAPRSERRTYHIAARDGTIFTQTRDVPLGSNFPHGGDRAPRPAVVLIRRDTDAP